MLQGEGFPCLSIARFFYSCWKRACLVRASDSGTRLFLVGQLAEVVPTLGRLDQGALISRAAV